MNSDDLLFLFWMKNMFKVVGAIEVGGRSVTKDSDVFYDGVEHMLQSNDAYTYASFLLRR